VPLSLALSCLILSILASSPATHFHSATGLDPSGSRGRDSLFNAHPEYISLGDLNPGHSRRVSFSVRNTQPVPVRIDRLETSCHCLTISPSSIHVGPGESQALLARYEASEEDGFSGALSVEVVGYQNGNVAFKSYVHLQVLPSHAQRLKNPARHEIALR
jgi:hypothetical protein